MRRARRTWNRVLLCWLEVSSVLGRRRPRAAPVRPASCTIVVDPGARYLYVVEEGGRIDLYDRTAVAAKVVVLRPGA